jgi:hypothetical protein
VAFTLLVGTSQGVITIVRGAVPLALFGSKGYGPCSAPSRHRHSGPRASSIENPSPLAR